jgi:Do/DeqQ family serine protease
MNTKTVKLLVCFFLAVNVSVFAVKLSAKPSEQANLQSESPIGGKLASAIGTDFTVAAELSVHTVVHVKTKTPVQVNQFQQFGFPNDPFFDFFFGRPQQPRNQEMPMREGSGSGVIISSDGYIVTNNHVIDRSKEIEVTLNDKRSFKAKVVGTDPNTDIALLKIEAKNLPVIRFGNSDSLKVGEWVLAVGNPFNLTSTVTAGIVSAKARNINIINSNMRIESFIQTDAAVNPGNSGGALVNTRGELIGINTAIASQTGSYAGYAFAVPSSIVVKVVDDLQKYGIVQRALLGVTINDITSEFAKEKNLNSLEGAYVNNVAEKGAAIAAGIKEGDVITHVNGMKVKSVAELQEQIGRYRPGDVVTITVNRKNAPKDLQVTLKNKNNEETVITNEGIEKLGAIFNTVTEKQQKELAISGGVQVTQFEKNSILQKEGMQKGFIITKINNTAINNLDDLREAVSESYSNASSEKVLFVSGIYPNGKIAYFAINLAEK